MLSLLLCITTDFTTSLLHCITTDFTISRGFPLSVHAASLKLMYLHVDAMIE